MNPLGLIVFSDVSVSHMLLFFCSQEQRCSMLEVSALVKLKDMFLVFDLVLVVF